jgi:hypothetical protein
MAVVRDCQPAVNRWRQWGKEHCRYLEPPAPAQLGHSLWIPAPVSLRVLAIAVCRRQQKQGVGLNPLALHIGRLPPRSLMALRRRPDVVACRVSALPPTLLPCPCLLGVGCCAVLCCGAPKPLFSRCQCLPLQDAVVCGTRPMFRIWVLFSGPPAGVGPFLLAHPPPPTPFTNAPPPPPLHPNRPILSLSVALSLQ